MFAIGVWPWLTFSRLPISEDAPFGQPDASNSVPEAALSLSLKAESVSQTAMSTHQAQSSTFRGLFHTPVVSSRFLITSRTELASLFGESQQPPETPLRLTTSRALHEVQTPDQTRPLASSVANPTLQSPINLVSSQPFRPPRSPRATLTHHIPQRGSQTTHSPFVIHRNPNFRHQPRPPSRVLAPPLQSSPILLNSSRISLHTPSYAQRPDSSMTPIQPPRLTYSPSTLQSPVAVTPDPHENLIFTMPGSDIRWGSEAPQTPFTP